MRHACDTGGKEGENVWYLDNPLGTLISLAIVGLIATAWYAWR